MEKDEISSNDDLLETIITLNNSADSTLKMLDECISEMSSLISVKPKNIVFANNNNLLKFAKENEEELRKLVNATGVGIGQPEFRIAYSAMYRALEENERGHCKNYNSVSFLREAYKMVNMIGLNHVLCELAQRYITAFAVCLYINRDCLKKQKSDILLLKSEFENIINCMKCGEPIKIADKNKFYNAVKTWCYAINEDKKDDTIDLAADISNAISNYNYDAKLNLKVKKIYNYVISKPVEKQNYAMYPSFDDEDFLTIMSKARKLLEVSDDPDLSAKLAVFDMHIVAYYKTREEVKVKKLEKK